MYIDDHGEVADSKPVTPPGSLIPTKKGVTCTTDNKVCCTPFVYGYTFDAWHGVDIETNDRQSWRVITPTMVARNWGYAISGIQGEFDHG